MDTIDDEEQCYVGQTCDPVRRNKEHFSKLKNGKGNYLFQNSFDKSGIEAIENFTARRLMLISIPHLPEMSDAAHALEVTAVEQEWIDKKGSNNVSKVAGAIDIISSKAAYSGILLFSQILTVYQYSCDVRCLPRVSRKRRSE